MSGQRARESKYHMPPIHGCPPVMRAPRRVHGTNGFPKRIHVACFYKWVTEQWNKEHPENPFKAFEGEISVDRRNSEHKKLIGEVLREHIPELYRRKTLSQAKVSDFSNVKIALDAVKMIPDLQPYVVHTHNAWAVEKLVDQHMESVSRSFREKRNAEAKRNRTDVQTENNDCGSIDNDMDFPTARRFEENVASRARNAFRSAEEQSHRYDAVPDLENHSNQDEDDRHNTLDELFSEGQPNREDYAPMNSDLLARRDGVASGMGLDENEETEELRRDLQRRLDALNNRRRAPQSGTVRNNFISPLPVSSRIQKPTCSNIRQHNRSRQDRADTGNLRISNQQPRSANRRASVHRNSQNNRR